MFSSNSHMVPHCSALLIKISFGPTTLLFEILPGPTTLLIEILLGPIARKIHRSRAHCHCSLPGLQNHIWANMEDRKISGQTWIIEKISGQTWMIEKISGQTWMIKKYLGKHGKYKKTYLGRHGKYKKSISGQTLII